MKERNEGGMPPQENQKGVEIEVARDLEGYIKLNKRIVATKEELAELIKNYIIPSELTSASAISSFEKVPPGIHEDEFIFKGSYSPSFGFKVYFKDKTGNLASIDLEHEKLKGISPFKEMTEEQLKRETLGWKSFDDAILEALETLGFQRGFLFLHQEGDKQPEHLHAGTVVAMLEHYKQGGQQVEKKIQPPLTPRKEKIEFNL